MFAGGLPLPRSNTPRSSSGGGTLTSPLVDERENRMEEESDELGGLMSKLPLGDSEMSIETYIQMEREEITEPT